mmetsp:Transcript_72878/g.126526  ORF Transcript_72878/g.126526 Transcript_72878/m.126526 type:complete len:89 (-) Transcript_72878:79-345(-)
MSALLIEADTPQESVVSYSDVSDSDFVFEGDDDLPSEVRLFCGRGLSRAPRASCGVAPLLKPVEKSRLWQRRSCPPLQVCAPRSPKGN